MPDETFFSIVHGPCGYLPSGHGFATCREDAENIASEDVRHYEESGYVVTGGSPELGAIRLDDPDSFFHDHHYVEIHGPHTADYFGYDSAEELRRLEGID